MKVLILDYDGTLAPFTAERDKAFPYPGVTEVLESLISNPYLRVVLVTGRSIESILSLLNLTTLPEIWGSHGLEHLSKEGVYTAFKPEVEALKDLEQAKILSQSLAPPGSCEIKPFSVALHWRGEGENTREKIEEEIAPRWTPLLTHLEIHPFEGGLELRLKGKNKGDAIKSLLSTLSPSDSIAYLGDDLTDEEAFRALGARGLKILVKKEARPTEADIRLVPPEELLNFLKGWLAYEQ